MSLSCCFPSTVILDNLTITLASMVFLGGATILVGARIPWKFLKDFVMVTPTSDVLMQFLCNLLLARIYHIALPSILDTFVTYIGGYFGGKVDPHLREVDVPIKGFIGSLRSMQ